MIWSFESLHSFMPPPSSSRAPIDHVAIQVTLVGPKEQRGNDLKFINERVFEMPESNAEIARIIKSHVGDDPTAPIANPVLTLLALKSDVRKYGLKATADQKKQDTEAAARLKQTIAILRARIDRGEADQCDFDTLAEDRTTLAGLSPAQRTLNDSVEEQAYTRGAGHDTGSAAMYRAITPKSRPTSGSTRSSRRTGPTPPHRYGSTRKNRPPSPAQRRFPTA